jgi:hypothetical protein
MPILKAFSFFVVILGGTFETGWTNGALKRFMLAGITPIGGLIESFINGIFRVIPALRLFPDKPL